MTHEFRTNENLGTALARTGYRRYSRPTLMNKKSTKITKHCAD